MYQTWRELLFAHWSFAVEDVRPLIPAPLELDAFDGRAWIGVVPFTMTGVRLRGLPPLLGTGAFHELNVRTYVTAGGVPGVWFFSLDAASRVAVRAARRWFHLPYFDARMRLTRRATVVDYESLRLHRGAPWASLRATWQIGAARERATAGSLDYFLTERYCLYAISRRGELVRGPVRHDPWQLHDAELTQWRGSMLTQIGLVEPAEAPHLRYSSRLPVEVLPLERLGSARE